MNYRTFLLVLSFFGWIWILKRFEGRTSIFWIEVILYFEVTESEKAILVPEVIFCVEVTICFEAMLGVKASFWAKICVKAKPVKPCSFYCLYCLKVNPVFQFECSFEEELCCEVFYECVL